MAFPAPGSLVMVAAGGGPKAVDFLLVPKFSMMAFAAAVEPLRVANRLAGKPLAW